MSNANVAKLACMMPWGTVWVRHKNYIHHSFIHSYWIAVMCVRGARSKHGYVPICYLWGPYSFIYYFPLFTLSLPQQLLSCTSTCICHRSFFAIMDYVICLQFNVAQSVALPGRSRMGQSSCFQIPKLSWSHSWCMLHPNFHKDSSCIVLVSCFRSSAKYLKLSWFHSWCIQTSTRSAYKSSELVDQRKLCRQCIWTVARSSL